MPSLEMPSGGAAKQRKGSRGIRSNFEESDPRRSDAGVGRGKKRAFCQTLAHSDTPETEFTIFENWLERVRYVKPMYGAEFTFTKNYESIMEGNLQGDPTEGKRHGSAAYF